MNGEVVGRWEVEEAIGGNGHGRTLCGCVTGSRRGGRVAQGKMVELGETAGRRTESCTVRLSIAGQTEVSEKEIHACTTECEVEVGCRLQEVEGFEMSWMVDDEVICLGFPRPQTICLGVAVM